MKHFTARFYFRTMRRCVWVSATFVCHMHFCVHACGGSNSVFQEAMECHSRGVRGQSALIPLLVIAYLSAALCWWLLHVNSLDECPLTGKVTARKTDRRGVAEWQGPTPPPPPKSPTVKQSHTFSAKHNLALVGAGPKWFLQLQAPKPEINQVITKFVPLLREFMMREI